MFGKTGDVMCIGSFTRSFSIKMPRNTLYHKVRMYGYYMYIWLIPAYSIISIRHVYVVITVVNIRYYHTQAFYHTWYPIKHTDVNNQKYWSNLSWMHVLFCVQLECLSNRVNVSRIRKGQYIPLSHYSRNAPRIHKVGHFFQIAKVPSGVCKSRPAFVLDSATFVAIAKCSQTQLRVGNLFHFPQNSWVHWEPNTTNIRVYEYDTMKQEGKTTPVRTLV